MLACNRSVPHGILWSTYKSPGVILDCLFSDFREDVLSHLSELCPFPSRQANCHLFKRLPCSLSPFAPKGTIHSRETGVLHKHSSWTKYVSCISFSLSRTSGHSDSQVQAQGLHQGFPLYPPQPNSSQLCKGFYTELQLQPQINPVIFRAFC